MALTKASLVDLNSGELILDLDADTSITADTDDTIHFKIGGTDRVTIAGSALSPSSANGSALGTTSLEWSDLFLADGAVISFGVDQDVTLTHVADTGLLLSSTDQLQFGDSGTYIHQSADGVLDLVSDTEIEINATTIDMNGVLNLSGNLVVGSATVTEAQFEILDGATVTTDELNILDGVTATTAEVNLLDGDTSPGTTAITDGDALIVNDGTTMRQTTVQTFATYFGSEITTMSNLVTTGALNSGSITSGFGTIDTGSSNITTTGVGAFGSLDISGNIDVDGTTNLDAVDIDGAVQLDATLTVGANDQGYDVILYGDTASANVTWDTSADDLIFNGAAGLIVPDGKLTLASTAVTSTAAELNKLDGAGTLAQAGKQTIWVPATAITPTVTNGCASIATVETTAGRPDMQVLDFDASSDEHAQFSVAFPKSWNAGTVTFQLFWTSTATDTGTCVFELQAVAASDNTTIDVDFGTGQTVSDAAQGAAEELYVSPESNAITIAGSPGDNELVFFDLYRDVSADNMEEDARVIGIKLFFTTDASNDA